MPFFSVVIPVYNKANYLKKTLQSVINQYFEDFEVILVNDGSTDNSLEIIKSFSDRRFRILSQDNQGASAARNRGVAEARSKWVALMDADDIWYPEHLKELYDCILKFPKAQVMSNAYQIELENNFIKSPAYSKPIPQKAFVVKDYFGYSLIDPLFWTSSIAFQKSCFAAIGQFDPQLKTGQDLDLIIRLALNYEMVYNPKVTLLYKRQTEHNLSLDVDLSEKSKYIDKNRPKEEKHPNLKRYLDINRFSLALQAKMKKESKLFDRMKQEIDAKNLNFKKRLLLVLPRFFLIKLKQLQANLIKFGIYRSAFK